MRKGGYKIVDFKGAELSSTVVVRPGIYSQIIDDYDKTILVSGVSLGGTLKDDSFASVSEVTGDSGDSVDLGVYGGVITVTEDDEITFTLSSTPAELDTKIGEVDAKVGDLDDLETTDKDSLVDAVNEVNGKTEDIIKVSSIQAANTGIIAVDTALSISAFDITASIPIGYRVILAVPVDTGDDGFLISSVLLTDNNTKLGYSIRNVGTSSHSGSPIFALICIKE